MANALRSAVAVLLLLALQCCATQGLRVLLVSTAASNSHYIWGNALAEGLLAAGHHVVEITTKMPDTPHPNRTTFAIGKFLSDSIPLGDAGEIMDPKKANPWTMMHILYYYRAYGSKWTCQSQAFNDTVNYLKRNKDKFDVMVIDYSQQEVLIGLAGFAGRPPIVVTTPGQHHTLQMYSLVGSPLTPALVPHDASLFDPDMSFLERVGNTLYYVMHGYGELIPAQKLSEQVYQEFFKETGIPMSDLIQDVALALVNTHPVLHGSRAIVPSVVEVGLMQVKPGKPITEKELKLWLDDAVDGFVFMSLGTIAKSSSLKPEKRRAILKVFASLKQRVLWKYESDDILDELPPNVRIAKWLPQNDILAHKNIKVFISHCGGLSNHEHLYNGVPVLGLPLFSDQFTNGQRNEKLGVGRTISLRDFNPQIFEEALKDVLNNPIYRANAESISGALRDQKETPLERAVWWVEHVGRTGGAPHLRSRALDLYWFQVYLLDVIAVLTAGPLLLLWLLKVTLARVLRMWRAGRSRSTPHAKKE